MKNAKKIPKDNENDVIREKIMKIKKELIEIEIEQGAEQGEKYIELEKEKKLLLIELRELVSKLKFSEDELKIIKDKVSLASGWLNPSLSDARKKEILEDRELWLKANYKAI